MRSRAKAHAIESIPVEDFFESFGEDLKLRLVAGASGLRRKIQEKSINRPSLFLTGFRRYFAAKRIQLFGAGEMGYLREMSESRQRVVLTEMLTRRIPCVIVSRNLAPTKPLLEIAERVGVPLFRSSLTSWEFMVSADILLEGKFAPWVTESGTMLDVKGIGILLRGGSGIGKSECALGLIEQGHSLVADDVIHVKLLHDRELMATCNELNRGYMECRGLGIIDVSGIFGIRSIRLEKRIDLVVSFVEWMLGMVEERTGLEQNFYEILGIQIPHIELPVRPGRDLAHLVEMAAMVQALKGIGQHPAKEFNERLIAHMMERKSSE